MSQIYRVVGMVSIVAFVLAGGFLWWRSQEKTPSVSHKDPRLQVHGQDVYQMVTGNDGEGDRSRWESLLNTHTYLFGKEPEPFLKQNIELLPVGKALDIAMGEGRNAVFLAKKGFQVVGVDFSEAALRKARRLAKEHGVSIETINEDLRHYQIPAGEYDVIVNINYLQRDLIPQMRSGLRSGGVVVFQSHTVDQLHNPSGQTTPKSVLLKTGELRELFQGFRILLYQETNDGEDAYAQLIAQKP